MKKVTVAGLVLTLLMICVAVSPAVASASTSPYTITTGKLGGADYVIYMPTNWNGRLIMGCPGYNAMENPHPELIFDALAKELASAGYAFAASNYNGGERAYLVKEGIIRTHQLTKYIVDNYQVTDKIFVIGASMGGAIALNLARKYPDLYSGVLDVCGLKDYYNNYLYSQIWVTGTVAEIRAALSLPASMPDAIIMMLKGFFATVSADTIEAMGGTPMEKPKAYERTDPVFHPELKVPTISLLGGRDILLPLFLHLNFEAAVTAAGCSDLYRMYIVPTGGHLDEPIQAEMYATIMELIAWSDSLD